MKISKLQLRGAIGIKKGLGVDEIEIDFSKFEKGLIALTGRNGSGKTTIMENLHPYRQMVSRAGSLQTHFFLKDSYRVLEFEHEDKFYQSKILIDALTGGSEAYLFQCDLNISNLETDSINWNALNDGKLTTYDAEIEKLLGSPELFFNSVFSGQKSKGIAELKPADRRKLFYELLNLNVYEGYLELAKADLKKAEIKLSEIEGSIRSLTADAPNADELEQQRIKFLNEQAVITAAISDLETEIENCENQIRETEINIATSKEKLKGNEDLEKKIKLISEKIDSATKDHKSKLIRLNSEVEDNRKLIERNQRLVSNKGKITSTLAEKKEIESHISKLNSERSVFVNEVQVYQDEYLDKQKEISESTKLLYEKKEQLSESINEIDKLKVNIYRIENETKIIDEVPCEKEIGANCQFLKNAYSSKEVLPGYKTRYNELTATVAGMKEVNEKLEKDIAKQKILADEIYQTKSGKSKAEIARIDSELKLIKNKLDEINKEDWEKLSKEADQAENNIKLLEQKLETANSSIKDTNEKFEADIYYLKADVTEAHNKLDLELPKKISSLEDKLALLKGQLFDLSSALTNKNNTLDSLEISIKEIDVILDQLKNTQKRIDELNKQRKNIQQEITDWTFLCKAFDKTGIPVLKLENSGIEITTIANELLSLFENKFRIVFETTSLTKDKKKTKDTFDINIIEDDGVCEIGNKSGGQQVWLETAIQLSISLVVRNQGRNIETAFLDEKDGALDLDNAYSYIEMLRKAHEMSGVHNTFVITHRTELLDFIPQQVKLTDGYLQILN